jgi:hypothetical protein
MFIFFTGLAPQKNWEVSTDQWLRGLHFEKDQCLGNLGGGYAKLSFLVSKVASGQATVKHCPLMTSREVESFAQLVCLFISITRSFL